MLKRARQSVVIVGSELVVKSWGSFRSPIKLQKDGKLDVVFAVFDVSVRAQCKAEFSKPVPNPILAWNPSEKLVVRDAVFGHQELYVYRVREDEVRQGPLAKMCSLFASSKDVGITRVQVESFISPWADKVEWYLSNQIGCWDSLGKVSGRN